MKIALMVSLPQIGDYMGRKVFYTIKEPQIVGEAGDVLEETITSWIEKL